MISVQMLGSHEHVLDAIRRGQPAVVKLVNPSPDWVTSIQNFSPNTLIVGRWQPLEPWDLTELGGRNFAMLIAGKAFDTGIRHWEGSNEAASGLEAIKYLNEFEYGFADECNQMGLLPIVGGFSTGTPDIVGDPIPNMHEWEAFYPAMQIAWGVHVHEYWDPLLLLDTWNAYRYQMWYPALPDWAQQKWWLISELGIDGGIAGNPGEGWRNYISPSQYRTLLDQYGQELSNYPRFASTVFLAGLGADSYWQSFDIAETVVLDWLVETWTHSNKTWGIDASQPDVEVLDDMLSRRLAAATSGPSLAALNEFDRALNERLTSAGIEYDNLIGYYADEPGASCSNPRDLDLLNGFAFHHTASDPLVSTTAIYNTHIQNELGGMGYHFIGYCARLSSGGIWRKLRMVRNPLTWGAHVKGNNDHWIGYCWPGQYDETPPDNELLALQAEMYSIVHSTVVEWLGLDSLDLQSHREILPGHTACPDGETGWFRQSFVPLIEGSEPPEPDCNKKLDEVLNLIETLYKEVEGMKR